MISPEMTAALNELLDAIADSYYRWTMGVGNRAKVNHNFRIDLSYGPYADYIMIYNRAGTWGYVVNNPGVSQTFEYGDIVRMRTRMRKSGHEYEEPDVRQNKQRSYGNVFEGNYKVDWCDGPKAI